MSERTAEYVNVILAAGFSRRFGSDKREKLLSKTCQRICDNSKLDTFVVLRASDAAKTEKLGIPNGISGKNLLFISDDENQGLGSSLSFAVRQIEQITPAKGIVIYLGDMPFIDGETINNLEKVLVSESSEHIVATHYKNKRGHPVAFSSNYFDQLIQLKGDKGARQIIESNAGEVVLIASENAGVLADIDTPADMEAWRDSLD